MPQTIHTLSCEDAVAFVCEATWCFAEVDPSGNFRWVNKAFCDLLNAQPEQILETNFRDWTHPDDLGTDVELAEQVKNGERRSYTLAKRYIRYGYPPGAEQYTWGLLSVHGKWKAATFQGYRVQYQPYAIPQKQTRKLSLDTIAKALQWTVDNWKAMAIIAALVTSLMQAGSSGLLKTLKEVQATTEAVDKSVSGHESSSSPGASQQRD